MDVSRRRAGARSSVVAGSVWESRMKSDEVRGGIKVFNGEENSEGGGNGGTRLKRSPIGGVVASGKRKTWKSESSEGFDRNQIQIARGKSEPQKNCDEQCEEFSISSDGIKKSPIYPRKLKIEGNREVGASADKFKRSPILTRNLRSETLRGTAELGKEASESGEGAERTSGQLIKSKLDSIKTADQNVKIVAGSANGNGENSIQLWKTKSESDQVLDESENRIDGGNENIPFESGKNDPDENCKDFGVCQDKVISSSSEKMGVVQCSPELSVRVDGDSVIDDEADEGEEEDEVVDEEFEIAKEKASFDVKEISIPESKAVMEPEKKKVVKEPENKKVQKEVENKKAGNEPRPKNFLSIQRRFQQNERPVSIPLTVKQSSPIKKHSTIYQNFTKANSIPKAEEYHSFPQTQNKLQSLVDLIMWRDVSRSAFAFGIGTFVIASSSYAKDINVSSISVMSYLGLVYLAVVFLYRSLICRGVIDVEGTNYVVGEEEAIWVLKLILPYLNEFLLKLRALFSGDPGTTMKLAVLLFVLARCGSSITIWKMAKFGFFGVFTLPKIYSLYSTQLTSYANFWVRRFRDAWESCSHKKAVALGIFGLVWNLASVVARIWAVFLLFVALKYYQQHYLVRDEWVEEEAELDCEETWQGPVGVGGQRQGRGPTLVERNKVKKEF